MLLLLLYENGSMKLLEDKTVKRESREEIQKENIKEDKKPVNYIETKYPLLIEKVYLEPPIFLKLFDCFHLARQIYFFHLCTLNE